MTTPEQGLDLQALEAMVDRHSVKGVLEMLAEICDKTGERVNAETGERTPPPLVQP